MKRTRRTVYLWVVFLLFSSTIALAGQFNVMRVYDGDSIKANGHDITVKVRLVGIDAPEMSNRKRKIGQPYSQKSKKYLSELILNKTVYIKGYGLDRYNRVLGEIYYSGKNINLEMIKAGMAETYKGRNPKNFNSTSFIEAEMDARKDNRGIWSLGDKYISPKDWRKISNSN